MSSAIEVLKEMLEGDHCIYECCIGDPVKANTVKEALLALEQKEKLKEWLEKEIADADKYAKEWFDANEIGLEKDWNDRGNVLKEVLNKVGEQK